MRIEDKKVRVEKENMIELDDNIVIKQQDKKIILEKGDRVQIVETKTRFGWIYDSNDLAFSGEQTITMEGDPEIVIVYLGESGRYSYQFLSFDKNGKLLKKINYSKYEVKLLLENFDSNYPQYNLSLDDLKFFK